LQKSGDRQAAKYHYQQVLAANLPDSVKRNVYQQLGDIRERLPSLRLSLDLVSDSNPKQSTNSRVVKIGGKSYTLNDAGSAKSVIGLLVTADASLPLPSNPSWYAHAYGEAYEYPGRELDLLYGEASVGKRFDYSEHSLALEAGMFGSTYQDKQLYTGILARSNVFMRPLPKLALVLDASIKSYDYKNLTYLSGNLVSIGFTNIYVPSPTQRWDFGANIAQYSADEAAYSYTQPGLSARFLQEWAGGWITGARLQGLVANYDAPDPFFGETRHDKEARVELDVLNRKLKLWAFSPKLLVGFVKRNSSLDLYSYDRAYVRAGLSTEF
jgi:outer membrane protein